MSARWEQKLQQFQRALEAFRNYAAIDLYYGVVHIRGPQTAPNDRATPLISASGGTLVETLTVPITAEEHQLHLLFGTDHSPGREDLLSQFKTQLRELHDILPILPQRVLPPSRLPAMANGGDENFVRWGLALIWLGAREQKVFHSEVEFAESASSFRINGRVSPWEKLSPVPGFDPIELVTRTGKPEQGWPYWSQEHAKAGRTFPEVLAVSLTKPIFYASVNAVDLLIQSGREQRPAERKVRLQGRQLSDGTALEGMELQVHSVLMKHHCGENGPNFGEISQSEIAKRLNVSQPTVHRALKGLLDRIAYGKYLDVSDRYASLCSNHLIVGVLEHIENPRRRDEFTSSSLDFRAGDGD